MFYWLKSGTRAFFSYFAITLNKVNANIRGIIKKELRMGEVPAKDSSTNMCVLKQGGTGERG